MAWEQFLKEEKKFRKDIQLLNNSHLNIGNFKKDIDSIYTLFHDHYTTLKEKKKSLDLRIFQDSNRAIFLVIFMLKEMLKGRKQQKLTQLQLQLDELKIPQTLVFMFSNNEDRVLDYLIIETLILLLKNANRDIQESIYHVVSQHQVNHQFFSKLRQYFLENKSCILNAMSRMTFKAFQGDKFTKDYLQINDFHFMIQLLKLLQNFCENCNEQFQIYLSDHSLNTCCNFLKLTVDFFIEICNQSLLVPQ